MVRSKSSLGGQLAPLFKTGWIARKSGSQFRLILGASLAVRVHRLFPARIHRFFRINSASGHLSWCVGLVRGGYGQRRCDSPLEREQPSPLSPASPRVDHLVNVRGFGTSPWLFPRSSAWHNFRGPPLPPARSSCSPKPSSVRPCCLFSWQDVWVSQASAQQRRGRAGVLGRGAASACSPAAPSTAWPPSSRPRCSGRAWTNSACR
jgi:hypothetical protein